MPAKTVKPLRYSNKGRNLYKRMCNTFTYGLSYGDDQIADHRPKSETFEKAMKFNLPADLIGALMGCLYEKDGTPIAHDDAWENFDKLVTTTFIMKGVA